MATKSRGERDTESEVNECRNYAEFQSMLAGCQPTDIESAARFGKKPFLQTPGRSQQQWTTRACARRSLGPMGITNLELNMRMRRYAIHLTRAYCLAEGM